MEIEEKKQHPTTGSIIIDNITNFQNIILISCIVIFFFYNMSENEEFFFIKSWMKKENHIKKLKF